MKLSGYGKVREVISSKYIFQKYLEAQKQKEIQVHREPRGIMVWVHKLHLDRQKVKT